MLRRKNYHLVDNDINSEYVKLGSKKDEGPELDKSIYEARINEQQNKQVDNELIQVDKIRVFSISEKWLLRFKNYDNKTQEDLANVIVEKNNLYENKPITPFMRDLKEKYQKQFNN